MRNIKFHKILKIINKVVSSLIQLILRFHNLLRSLRNEKSKEFSSKSRN